LLQLATQRDADRPAGLAELTNELALEVEKEWTPRWLRIIGVELQPIDVGFRQAVRLDSGIADLARYGFAGGTRKGKLTEVLKYFRSLKPRRLVIVGDPGAGKTVLAIQLMVRLLEARRRGEENCIPVFLSLSAWDTRRSLDSWLVDHL